VEGREAFPLIALSAVQELRAYLDEVEAASIRRAREMGASADDIAEALGITRQGAYYKMKKLESDKTPQPRAVDEIRITLPEAESPETEGHGRRSGPAPGRR
jgi:erythromycin esterase-like protein